jgi:hypothetical protein
MLNTAPNAVAKPRRSCPSGIFGLQSEAEPARRSSG